MPILALDTSGETASIAVRKATAVSSVAFDVQECLTEQLPKRIHSLLHDSGLEISRLDAIAVGTGPGSYTGIRVGIAYASMSARALGIRLYGVPSLLGTCVSTAIEDRRFTTHSGTVVATANAYRKTLYVRKLAFDKGTIPDTGKDEIVPEKKFRQNMAAVSRNATNAVTIIGYGCVTLMETGPSEAGVRLLREPVAPGAEAILTTLDKLGDGSFRTSPSGITAIYLRKSSAEIQKETKQP
ncbi:MAG: tRNA (adenosine(37)-N6)-threonylcarbamoyltransferase complex dimerization subunit type 1 TsaB [Planctomycetes bacterium]|nr:tRNA (adenosine(37)-N6)-threonylcarbamoyltransferase complex dimerization subunit type 1 TsaB [Planctomycetota bacterium]